MCTIAFWVILQSHRTILNSFLPVEPVVPDETLESPSGTVALEFRRISVDSCAIVAGFVVNDVKVRYG